MEHPRLPLAVTVAPQGQWIELVVNSSHSACRDRLGWMRQPAGPYLAR